jgi:hypothetical protein
MPNTTQFNLMPGFAASNLGESFLSSIIAGLLAPENAVSPATHTGHNCVGAGAQASAPLRMLNRLFSTAIVNAAPITP